MLFSGQKSGGEAVVTMTEGRFLFSRRSCNLGVKNEYSRGWNGETLSLVLEIRFVQKIPKQEPPWIQSAGTNVLGKGASYVRKFPRCGFKGTARGEHLRQVDSLGNQVDGILAFHQDRRGGAEEKIVLGPGIHHLSPSKLTKPWLTHSASATEYPSPLSLLFALPFCILWLSL